MKDMSWINDPALKNINAKKLAIIVNLINDCEKKSPEKALLAFFKANSELTKNNLSFSKEETNLLLDILTKDMSSEEKNKLNMLQNMIPKN